MSFSAGARPARDAKVFEPSTFGSRRAAGDVSRPQRIVSLGVSPTWLPDLSARRSGHGRMVDVEYLYDIDRSSRRYRRVLPYGQLEPLFDSQPPEKPEPLGFFRSARGQSSGHYPTTGTADRVERVT